MYIETSQNNSGLKVYCSFERRKNLQNSISTCYQDRFSILTNDSLKSMGRFRLQLNLWGNKWSPRCKIPENETYRNSSIDWTLLSLKFTVEIYGIKLTNDQIERPHAEMCFSNITIPHSLFWMDHINNFKDMIESIQNFREIVFSMFLNENDADLIHEGAFSKNC